MTRGRPPIHARPDDGRRVFVRYPNRRLYDTKRASYVSIGAILRRRAGSFVVGYGPTGQDITRWCVDAARHEREGKLLRATWRGIEKRASNKEGARP